MSVQLILKNSSVQDKAATAQQLEIGEIALNYHESGPFLQCKDTAGQVWRIGGVIVSDEAPGQPQPGTWWFETDTRGLYLYDGTGWNEITGGGGGAGDITAVVAGDGLSGGGNTGTVTLDADLDLTKGLEFIVHGIDGSKIAIKPGANISFDADGSLRADIASVSIKGTVDLTSATIPSPVTANDGYYNNVNGTMSAEWQAATGEAAIAVYAGDSVIYNGTDWAYIPAAPATVASVFGRIGAVVATEGDYDLDELGDVDLTSTPPINNDVLQYNGSAWVPATGTSLGYWDRTGTVLSPANTGDALSVDPGSAAAPTINFTGDTNTGIYSPGANQVAVATNGTGRLFVNADGSIDAGSGANGIFTLTGTVNSILKVKSPDTGLSTIFFSDVSADGIGRIGYRHVDDSMRFMVNNAERVFITSAGNVIIGGTLPPLPNISLNADGSATFTGTVTATVTPPSDARFKENITPANPQLADVVALGKQLKNFDWNDEAPLNDELRAVRQLGLIAQEAERVSPGIVKTIKRTKQGKELTPEKVIPAVYKEVVDPQDEENFSQELVTPEQIIPATYEEVDDSFKGISQDALIMKLLGAVAELSAEVEALKAVK